MCASMCACVCTHMCVYVCVFDQYELHILRFFLFQAIQLKLCRLAVKYEMACK